VSRKPASKTKSTKTEGVKSAVATEELLASLDTDMLLPTMSNQNDMKPNVRRKERGKKLKNEENKKTMKGNPKEKVNDNQCKKNKFKMNGDNETINGTKLTKKQRRALLNAKKEAMNVVEKKKDKNDAQVNPGITQTDGDALGSVSSKPKRPKSRKQKVKALPAADRCADSIAADVLRSRKQRKQETTKKILPLKEQARESSEQATNNDNSKERSKAAVERGLRPFPRNSPQYHGGYAHP
jgi:CHAT domain-containing protein